MTDQPPAPLTLDDIADMLGKPRITLPKPIATPVRQVRICPCCGWPHPSDIGCKSLQRLDHSGR